MLSSGDPAVGIKVTCRLAQAIFDSHHQGWICPQTLDATRICLLARDVDLQHRAVRNTQAVLSGKPGRASIVAVRDKLTQWLRRKWTAGTLIIFGPSGYL